MKFKNPENDQIDEISELAWLWVFFFGVFYFLLKGVWTHAAGWLLLAPITAGISLFVYAYYAKDIMEKHYQGMGWIQVDGT